MSNVERSRKGSHRCSHYRSHCEPAIKLAFFSKCSATAARVGPAGASILVTFKDSISARVSPTFSIAIGVPFPCAARTCRKADHTASEVPTTIKIGDSTRKSE